MICLLTAATVAATATAAEAIILLTPLAVAAATAGFTIPIVTAEAAKLMIIKFGLQAAFSELLKRCEAVILEQIEKGKSDA